MADPAALDAVIDTASLHRNDGQIAASLIIRNGVQIPQVFYVTWKPGHAQDWSWQGEDSWVQTEVYAEHIGIEPARLIALAEKAVAEAAKTLDHGPA